MNGSNIYQGLIDGAAAGVQAMIDPAAEGPTIAAAYIDFACGNCVR
jgi:hypothetical protein